MVEKVEQIVLQNSNFQKIKRRFQLIYVDLIILIRLFVVNYCNFLLAQQWTTSCGSEWKLIPLVGLFFRGNCTHMYACGLLDMILNYQQQCITVVLDLIKKSKLYISSNT
ncbi:hypothetical protein T07_10419 [Trichinella nelsoni]|uniref:Transmembrane protein n=1 Tax=Trichinella nelsoni TaxID=6336 RepID=A0A0V0RI89_9BILA|nr:hypothetical protein T07_10419 [Trichinella nelsoni]